MNNRYKQMPDLIHKIKEYFQNRKVPTRIVFIIVGLLSTVWFLIRVIPKPIRATYPCMQATAPIMSGFIAYLIGIMTTFLAYKKAKMHMANAKYITAAAFIVIAISAVIFTITEEPQFVYADVSNVVSPVGLNDPVGIARGVNPGRVVWVWNPDATNEDYYCSEPDGNNVWTNGYWKDHNTNLQVVDSMMADAVTNLIGKETVSESWDSLFHYFNRNHGKGDIGYQPGEKIFIKVNHCKIPARDINDDFTVDSTNNGQYNRTATAPQPTIAVIRQLVNQAGIPDTCITMGDPHKNIYKHLYDPLYVDFPGLVFLAHDGGVGRLKVRPADTASVIYSDKGMVLTPLKDYLCKSMEDADYLINIAANKGRNGGSSGTMCAKNHFGSIAVGDGSNPAIHSNAGHLHDGIFGGSISGGVYYPRNAEYGLYRVMTDLMGHKYIGENTILYVTDGLWSCFHSNGGKRRGQNKWKSVPFNGDFPSSIFVSQDGVAIEAVCMDFLLEEYTYENYPAPPNPSSYDTVYAEGGAVYDYLLQAADSAYWPEGIDYDPEDDGMVIPSLGVFERWNNSIDKQYTRNLGTGNGIELIKVAQDPTPIKGKSGANPISFTLYDNYPNPFNPTTTINYELQITNYVELSIYNLIGQKVTTLVSEKQPAGTYQVEWNAVGFASGVYYYRLISETGFVQTKKLTLLK